MYDTVCHTRYTWYSAEDRSGVQKSAMLHKDSKLQNYSDGTGVQLYSEYTIVAIPGFLSIIVLPTLLKLQAMTLAIRYKDLRI